MLAQARKGNFVELQAGIPEDASRLLYRLIVLESGSYLSEAVVLCCAFSCDFVAFAAVWCFTGP